MVTFGFGPDAARKSMVRGNFRYVATPSGHCCTRAPSIHDCTCAGCMASTEQNHRVGMCMQNVRPIHTQHTTHTQHTQHTQHTHTQHTLTPLTPLTPLLHSLTHSLTQTHSGEAHLAAIHHEHELDLVLWVVKIGPKPCVLAVLLCQQDHTGSLQRCSKREGKFGK